MSFAKYSSIPTIRPMDKTTNLFLRENAPLQVGGSKKFKSKENRRSLLFKATKRTARSILSLRCGEKSKKEHLAWIPLHQTIKLPFRSSCKEVRFQKPTIFPGR